jgi:YggT family protein
MLEALPVALARDDIANYVSAVFVIYIILIFARILLSYIPRIPYTRWGSAIVGFITETTDPYLNFFRRFIPPVGGGGFALDLSPVVGIILLLVAQAVVVSLIRG